MKKVHTLLSTAMVALLILTACSSKSTSKTDNKSNAKLPDSIISTVGKQQPHTFSATSGKFSFTIKGEWTDLKDRGGFDLTLSHASSSDNLGANQYEKVNYPLTVKEFANKSYSQPKDISILSQEEPSETNIANKSGFIRKVALKSANHKGNQFIFIFEDGNFYKMLSYVAWLEKDEEGLSAVKEKEAREYMAQAIESWQSQSITNEYKLTQTITLPQTSMTMSIPDNWEADTGIEASESLKAYIAKEKEISFRVNTVATNGQNFDLYQTVQASAQSIPGEKDIQEITIGGKTGYQIAYKETVNNYFYMQNLAYIFHINDYLITLHFSLLPSQVESFKPSLEAMIQSLK